MMTQWGRGPGLVSSGADGYPIGRPAEEPAQPPLYWPAIAGAGAFALVFIGGLTLTVLMSNRAAARANQPRPLPVAQTSPQRITLPDVPLAEGISRAVPAEAAPSGLEPAVPEASRPAAGLEQVVARAAASIPPSVSNPWPAAPPPESPAEVGPVQRPPVTCGTSVEFVNSPVLACKQAQKEHKLVFLLHISGDFEDPGFT